MIFFISFRFHSPSSFSSLIPPFQFLERCQRYNRAEDTYLKAIKANNKHLYALLIYGNFLLKRRQFRDSHIFLARVAVSLDSGLEVVDPLSSRPLEKVVRVRVGAEGEKMYESVKITSGKKGREKMIFQHFSFFFLIFFFMM